MIRCALSAGNVALSDLRSLEMHGTGTALGDPIEVGAACAVLDQVRPLPARFMRHNASVAWVLHAVVTPRAALQGNTFESAFAHGCPT